MCELTTSLKHDYCMVIQFWMACIIKGLAVWEDV